MVALSDNTARCEPPTTAWQWPEQSSGSSCPVAAARFELPVQLEPGPEEIAPQCLIDAPLAAEHPAVPEEPPTAAADRTSATADPIVEAEDDPPPAPGAWLPHPWLPHPWLPHPWLPMPTTPPSALAANEAVRSMPAAGTGGAAVTLQSPTGMMRTPEPFGEHAAALLPDNAQPTASSACRATEFTDASDRLRSNDWTATSQAPVIPEVPPSSVVPQSTASHPPQTSSAAAPLDGENPLIEEAATPASVVPGGAAADDSTDTAADLAGDRLASRLASDHRSGSPVVDVAFLAEESLPDAGKSVPPPTLSLAPQQGRKQHAAISDGSSSAWLPADAPLPKATYHSHAAAAQFADGPASTLETQTRQLAAQQLIGAALDQLKVVRQDGPRFVIVRLNPPRLGRLQLAVRESERGVRVQVWAENPVTRQLLADSQREILAGLDSQLQGHVELSLDQGPERRPTEPVEIELMPAIRRVQTARSAQAAETSNTEAERPISIWA